MTINTHRNAYGLDVYADSLHMGKVGQNLNGSFVGRTRSHVSTKPFASEAEALQALITLWEDQ